MDRIVQWIQSTLGLNPSMQVRVLASVLTVAILWSIRRIVLAAVARSTTDIKLRYRWRKTTQYVAVAIGALVLGGVWVEGVSSLATFLGLVSAGIAIALKDLLVNLAAWGFILWRRPFEVGDRIQIGDAAGDVIDVRIFQFTLNEIGNWVDADQSTGRIIHVPNGLVFTQPLSNYTRGFRYIWNELPVLVTFESNWEDAKTILLDITERHALSLSKAAAERLREASQQFMIFYTTLTPIVYTAVQDSGVMLTVRYLTDPRKRRSTSQAIWEDTLRAFAARDDIDFAYPTTRYYDNRREGKPGAGGPGPG